MRRDILLIGRDLLVIALIWLVVLLMAAAIICSVAGCGAAPIRFQEALEHWAYTTNQPLAPIEDTSIPVKPATKPEQP